MEKKHTYISRMLTSYWASRHGNSVHSFTDSEWFPQEFQGLPLWWPDGWEAPKSHCFKFKPNGEKQEFFFSHNLLRFTLIEQARSSAHFWVSSSVQKHGLLWWARNASCAPYLKQRFSSRHHDLMKEVIYFPSEYWEMENRFLKASKPKSSYLLSYIKGGAFWTSHLTLLYIFCLFCLHIYISIKSWVPILLHRSLFVLMFKLSQIWPIRTPLTTFCIPLMCCRLSLSILALSLVTDIPGMSHTFPGPALESVIIGSGIWFYLTFK